MLYKIKNFLRRFFHIKQRMTLRALTEEESKYLKTIKRYKDETK